jgi:DnaJ family protein C protein 11
MIPTCKLKASMPLTSDTDVAVQTSMSLMDLTPNLSLRWLFRASKYTKTSLKISFGSKGIQLEFGCTFGKSAYKFPIQFSPIITPWISLVAVVLPTALFAVGRYLYRWLESIVKGIEAHAQDPDGETRAHLRTVACRQQELLRPLASRNMTMEGRCDGLVIIRAVFGRADDLPSDVVPVSNSSSDSSSSSNSRGSANDNSNALVLDVTIPIQALVRQSVLHIPVGDKCVLLGFCDPMHGLASHLSNVLWLHYTIRGQPHVGRWVGNTEVTLST